MQGSRSCPRANLAYLASHFLPDAITPLPKLTNLGELCEEDLLRVVALRAEVE